MISYRFCFLCAFNARAVRRIESTRTGTQHYYIHERTYPISIHPSIHLSIYLSTYGYVQSAAHESTRTGPIGHHPIVTMRSILRVSSVPLTRGRL